MHTELISRNSSFSKQSLVEGDEQIPPPDDVGGNVRTIAHVVIPGATPLARVWE
jgi:hypothetical protein